ncbi:MAG: tetratricopeptide repeat protein [Candidatus Eisenbacteria bacterium]|uniref:Tetratricopeptide repeat protein n=1 Tax=Eiseniibacteriota bacterium TaxID=2212470 RepID=A0A538T537_UNCEI|nr:MAG: tetratricopeptide repeat protein [Candidatus Eisenbacteria bacterium]
MDATKHFSTRDTARILQSSEARLRTLARLGGVIPEPGPGGRPEFTFQQLLLLRTTKGLLEAGIPARRVRRIWSSLRRQLAEDLPLTSIRILADGDRAVAWDGNAPWQPDSGQFLLDLDAGEIAAEDPTLPDVAEAPRLTADQWFHLGSELEGTSPVEARQAYMQALEADPDFADAHLNLGRLDHEAGELGKAEAHYRDAVRCAPEDAICRFNLAVLLDDRGRPDEAILAYEQAIARDPDAADAHYNLGLLLESRGRRSDAMRHLMTARRLYALAGRGQ